MASPWLNQVFTFIQQLTYNGTNLPTVAAGAVTPAQCDANGRVYVTPDQILPGQNGIQITSLAADTVWTGPYPRALWIGNGGTLSVIFVGGSTGVNFINVPDQTFLPLNIKTLRSLGNGTTCTNITVVF